MGDKIHGELAASVVDLGFVPFGLVVGAGVRFYRFVQLLYDNLFSAHQSVIDRCLLAHFQKDQNQKDLRQRICKNKQYLYDAR